MVTAVAHPNIALVKYWGKADTTRNIPATPSISITLGGLSTQTQVTVGDEDRFVLDGAPREDTKVRTLLTALRERYEIPPLHIKSTNSFPTAAGIASSASGFAALVTAVDSLCSLKLNVAERSQWARRGSASAARSIEAGFVALSGPDWAAKRLASPADWPLDVVVAVTDTSRKRISSTRGMTLSRETSPYFDAWQHATRSANDQAAEAIEQRDFAQLADVAETSCLQMHALMLATRPPLIYWNAATVACIEAIRKLQADGVEVFFTIDAGPQVKAVCDPGVTNRVATVLGSVPGVLSMYRSALGEGARVIADSESHTTDTPAGRHR